MQYDPSPLAVVIFALFVGITLGLSFWLGRKAKSAQSFFAAHGQIPWFVNGVAFAGDYLSAASFLGICGMIAFYGYDGFLYSIGYLAGWIVALFVIAEPMKRLGKFTFADALDAKFGSPGIKIAAGISTLVVSLFYLIPQMVGAGALVKPLLNFDHSTGVIVVGIVVILIVVTAGMVSTTWVQFIKGTLLVLLCGLMVGMILLRGHRTDVASTQDGAVVPSVAARESAGIFNYGAYSPGTIGHLAGIKGPINTDKLDGTSPESEAWSSRHYYRCPAQNGEDVLVVRKVPNSIEVQVCQMVKVVNGVKLINGTPQKKGEVDFRRVGQIAQLPQGGTETGPLGPLSYLSTLQESEVIVTGTDKFKDDDGIEVTIYYPKLVKGSDLLVPGGSPTFAGIKSDKFVDKLDFISLMLALFCGTASLPHILIRYYTVKDQRAARLSTIVGIASIGVFYILTLYIGLAAMTSRVLDPSDSNMAAPLLARSFGEWMFAAVSAVAFTTVLGTVSGLILAASGAVAHDLMSHGFGVQLDDNGKVRVAKISAVAVGLIAIWLGIQFQGFNVTFLVGWAFNIAASANLPSLIMLLFWKKTTKQGIITAILVGLLSSLTWVLLSKDALTKLYGYPSDVIPLVPFSQPGIVTIPLGFLTLVLVSLMTGKPEKSQEAV
ncbi:MAG: cation acetate symporter [Planctomycetota bacterium]|nr:MAG: cation acetate symporter [Planctomycetota bacterium]